MPEITVVIPVFNSGRYLARCLDSVMNQSFRAIEIICINDASSDGSGAILRDAQGRDPRLRVLKNGSNLGAAQSRNRGIAAAKGRFIRFLDADDLLPLASTEVLYTRAVETGADVVRGSLALFENDDLNRHSVVSVSDRRTTSFKAEPSVWVPWWHTSYLISNDLIRANHLSYPNLRRGEDPVFLATVLVHARQISLLEDVVYCYRKYRKTTGSNAIAFADVADNLRHAEMVESLFRAYHPDSWELGYGPFLLKHFRSILKRCQCGAQELEVLRHRMEKIWGPGAYVMEPERGATGP